MAGYSRTNTADIQSGQVVKSAPINAELNAIVTAFAFALRTKPRLIKKSRVFRVSFLSCVFVLI